MALTIGLEGQPTLLKHDNAMARKKPKSLAMKQSPAPVELGSVTFNICLPGQSGSKHCRQSPNASAL